jgi:hypothetical protein
MLFIGSTKIISIPLNKIANFNAYKEGNSCIIGKHLFFRSGERGKGDIYWVSAKIIEDVRSKE